MGDTAMRFHRAVDGSRRTDGHFDDGVGLRQAGLDIAALVDLRLVAKHIAVRMNRWRTRRKRRLVIGHKRQLFVLDFDQIERVACKGGIGRGHDGDQIAPKAWLVGQQRGSTYLDIGQVFGRHDLHDAGQCLGGRRVDAHHACVWMRRSQHARP